MNNSTTHLKLDCHVHLIGNDARGSDCYTAENTFFRKLQSWYLLRAVGLNKRHLAEADLTDAYLRQLLHNIHTSSLDGALVLAMDWPYSDSGEPLKDKAAFYTPNDYVLSACRKHPELLPAVSIHPGRPDAIDELERCVSLGAKAIKLLPNVHNVDPLRKDYLPFWRKVARHNLVFICHTGGEQALPVANADYADPKRLSVVLDEGVTTVAAHVAGTGSLWEACYFKDWLAMLPKHPNLFGDNSALATPNRFLYLKRIIDAGVADRVLYGSDYPIPPSAYSGWLAGLTSFQEARHISAISNPLERDVAIKKACGFPYGSFTLLSRLLAHPIPPTTDTPN